MAKLCPYLKGKMKMLTITPRLGSLDAKARINTRTAKDGEEYSQLIFEVTDQEVSDSEINSLFSTQHAYAALKQLHRAIKGIKEIETDFKIEGAVVNVRLGAVSSKNGAQFKFEKCVVDKCKIGGLESDALKFGYRVTCKPALNAQFGELVSRFGHTAMIGLNAEVPNAQEVLPLTNGSADAKDAAPKTLEDAIAADAQCSHGKSMDQDCDKCMAEMSAGSTDFARDFAKDPIGTPDQEREKARLREVAIAQQLTEGRTHVDEGVGDGKTTAQLLATPAAKKRAKKAAGEARATH
jgi:hypothetical protein